MNSVRKERVEAAPFAAAEPVAPAPGETPSGPPRWALPALGGLAVLALVVVVWLPGALKPAQAPAESIATPGATAEVAPAETAPRPAGAPRDEAPAGEDAAAAPGSTPFAEAQSARLRREAQDILNELLDVRERLSARGAEQWAAEALEGINAQATEGDARYREREFEAAIDLYRQALERALALEERIPQQLQTHLAAAREAIEAGAEDRAQAELDIAGLLAPDSAEVGALAARLQALPEVLAAMQRASEAESRGEIEAAVSAAREAVAADSEHMQAGALLARLEAALEQSRYTAAMSEGYRALDASRFADARSAFRRAGALRSDSAEVSTALAEVDSAETAFTLRRLEERAAAAVAAEDWQQAVEQYEQAMAIDSTVLFAQRGLERARSRAQLDAGLERLLGEPLRLADERVAEAARQTLRLAQGVDTPGPRLTQQISALQRLLEQAATPIEVSLRSDGETEVTLLRVARLGQFEQRSLALRPGEYTATGQRRGFRDVRVSFVVTHEQPPPTITIACTEALPFE